MFKFLIAHALALEDKVDDMGPDSYMSQTPEDAYYERSRITQTMITEVQSSDFFGEFAG